jgi:predicted Zn-dependent protease
MYSHFSRIVAAFVLALSLGASGAVVTARPQQQTSNQQKAEQQKKDAQAKQASSTSKSTGARPLSTNEDPNMIGKRNINTGIIAKMSGGTNKEIALGRQLAAEVDAQAKFIDDPVITEYINRVGQNLVLHSDAKVPFTIKVIDSDEANAFALPGGFFYVNKGIILAADSESELAGVMAHEIAHVAARHAMKNQAKGQLMQGALIAGSIFLGGVPGMIINNVGGLGALTLFMKFSRNDESEADRLGVQYLYAAGYDPNGMSTMFEKLLAQNKKKPGFISKAFSSHPQLPDREASATALVARFPERDEYVISTSEFQRVKARLLRMSNARATTAGNLSGGEDGATPGRPTLKRRTPPPDNTTTVPDNNGNNGSDQGTTPPPAPPKLKRNPNANPPAQAPSSATSTPQ